MEKKDGKNSRRSIAKDLIQKGPDFSGEADYDAIPGRTEIFEEDKAQETRSLVDEGVQRLGQGDSFLVSAETDRLLNELGKKLGDEGYILIAGLLPYKDSPTGGWDLNTEKDPLRVTNINEAASVRVTMGLFAYLIESMQGDLAAEMGLETKMKGQKPA
jgi:hypothetical protein